MRLILSGGGTGGHVYPAIAIANKIKEYHPDAEILFVGTRAGIEAEIVPKYGYKIEYIDVQGFRRKIDFDNVKRLIKFLKSLSDSKRIIKKFKSFTSRLNSLNAFKDELKTKSHFIVS